MTPVLDGRPDTIFRAIAMVLENDYLGVEHIYSSVLSFTTYTRQMKTIGYCALVTTAPRGSEWIQVLGILVACRFA